MNKNVLKIVPSSFCKRFCSSTYIMYIRIIRHNIQYTLIIFGLLIILSVVWNLYHNDQHTSPVAQTPLKLLPYKCCTALNNSIRKNIFFMKTHKTGGTTVATILLRFAEHHSLNIMLMKPEHKWCPLSTKSLVSGTVTPDNKYNILATHTRYSSSMKSYQYPDTVTVTILRHPVALFESLYYYYNFDEKTGMTLEQFLKSSPKPKKLKPDTLPLPNGCNREYIGYNQMSVDLGLDLNNQHNGTAIHEFIEKIDNEFDFVMITEYMDASLVLLANLMGWPLEYMVQLNKNVRPPNSTSYTLTIEDEITLIELNQVDTLLYNHFLQKFRKCIAQYGVDKLNQQIRKLQQMNKQFEDNCIASIKYGVSRNIINYKFNRNTSDSKCQWDTKSMSRYSKELELKQRSRIAELLKTS